MKNRLSGVCFRVLGRTFVTGIFLLIGPLAQAADPKIAVTDLSYEEKVREFIQNLEMSGSYRSSSSGNASFRESDFSSSGRASGRSSESGSLSVKSSSGYQTYIDRGELR